MRRAGVMVGRLHEARRYHNVVGLWAKLFSTGKFIRDRFWESLLCMAFFVLYQRLRKLPRGRLGTVST